MKTDSTSDPTGQLSTSADAPVQWKIALGWMRDANMTAMGEEPHGLLTPPATRKLAEYHLNRYFEMVEAQIRPAG
jgi:hypothetical protein